MAWNNAAAGLGKPYAAKVGGTIKGMAGKAYDLGGKAAASIADDIRHDVVEKGWFDRRTTGNISKDKDSDMDLDGNAEDQEQDDFSQLYGTDHGFYGTEPDQEQAYEREGMDV